MGNYNAVILVSQISDAYHNLAVEKLLMKRGQDCVYLYLWQSKNAVVIGSNQNPFTECDLQATSKDEVQLARRMTGGGAVYHDLGNLNFSFIQPKEIYSEKDNFEIIISALKAFNINAEVSGRNDITVSGAKVSGNAFFKGKTACLHHGTLLISTDMQKLSSYLTPNALKLKKRGVKSVRSRVVNLSELNSKITTQSLIESLQKAFLSRYLGAKVLTVDEVINNDDLQAEIQILKSHEYLFGKWESNCEEKCKAFDWGMLSFSAKKNESERVIDLKVQTDCMYPLIAERVERAFIGRELSSVSQLENCTGVEDEIYNQIIAFIKENI